MKPLSTASSVGSETAVSDEDTDDSRKKNGKILY